MPLKHAILGFLNYQDMSGYDIDRWLEKPIAFFGMRRPHRSIRN